MIQRKKRNYNTNLKLNLEKMCSNNPKDYWGFWKRLQRQKLQDLQDLRKYINPKYGLKIRDLYLAYLLFADDIVLFSEFAENLQAQIELFYKYCEIWNLIISIAKTKIVIYNQIYAYILFPSHWAKMP